MTYTEAQAISDKGPDKVLHEQVYDNVPLLWKLKDMDQVQAEGGGTEWTWPIRIAKFGKANAVDPRADISYIAKETRTQVEDTPRHYVVSGIIPWDKLRANKGPAKKVDLVVDCTKEIKEDMDDRLGTDLYTANPNGNGITPIITAIDATATYAGLAYNDASIDTGSWNSIEDSATTKLELFGGIYGTSTYNSLSSMLSAATYGKNGPNFHLTTKELKSTFESILESQTVRQVNAKLGDSKLANAGFDNVYFKGSPVVSDPYCTAGLWLGIDLDAFTLLYDPDYYFVTTPWEKVSSAQEYSLKKNLAVVLQLKCERRRTSFKFTGLDAEQV